MIPNVKIVTSFAALAILTACASQYTTQSPNSTQHITESGQRSAVVLSALTLLNTPYRYGGTHPSTGFDCSGLVLYVFQEQFSIGMPRSTREQALTGRQIKLDSLQAGDLVFFNTLGTPYSHVGIYIGDGQFINAPSSGGQVRIDSLHNPYYKKRFTAARSLFDS